MCKKKLKLWYFYKEYDKSENEKIVIENPKFEDIFKYFYQMDGKEYSKFEIYNENAGEGEIYVIGMNKIFETHIFFYVIIENGKFVLKDRWYEKVEITDLEDLKENLKFGSEIFPKVFLEKISQLKCSYYDNEIFTDRVFKRFLEERYVEIKNIPVINDGYKGMRLGSFVKKTDDFTILEGQKKFYKRYFKYEIKKKSGFLKKEIIDAEIIVDKLTNKIITLTIFDKNYFPFEDMKIGDEVTEEMKEKYQLYFEEAERDNGYVSEIYKKFSIECEYEYYKNMNDYKDKIVSFTFGELWYEI